MPADTVVLPGGLPGAGGPHREAALVAAPGGGLDGPADFFDGPSASWVTQVLSESLARLGPWSPVPAETVRALSAGDRAALLLQLHRMAGQERLELFAACPRCASRMELDVAVQDLLLPPYAAAPGWTERTLDVDGVEWQVRLRGATGADLEAVEQTARSEPEMAAQALLASCVAWARPGDGPPRPLAQWPAGLRPAIEAALAGLDPQADLLLSATCPACGTPTDVALDPARLLFAGRAAAREAELEEIHVLAAHYHWSERDILGLPAWRRRRYLERIAGGT